MSDNVTKTAFGYEAVWAKTDQYVAKMVIFEAVDAVLPIHYHTKKQKTWFFNSGHFKIRWVDTKTGVLYEKDIKEGSVFHVPPNMPCGLVSLTDSGSLTEVTGPEDPEDFYQIAPEVPKDAT